MANDPESRPVVGNVDAGPNARIVVVNQVQGDLHVTPEEQRDKPTRPAYDPRARWQHLILLAMAVALLLGIWAASSLARVKFVEISSPRPGIGISNLEHLVYGNSSNVSSADEIWPVLFSRNDGHYYIHDNHTKLASDGRWCSTHVLLPADRAADADDFDIVVLLLNSEAAKVLYAELTSNPVLTRIQSLPAGAAPRDRIALKIVRPLLGETSDAPGCEAILRVKKGDYPSWLPTVSLALRLIGFVITAIGILLRLLGWPESAMLGRIGLQKDVMRVSLILGGVALLMLGVFSGTVASWIDKSRNREAAFRGSDSNKDLLHIDSGTEVDSKINVVLSSDRLRPGYYRWVVVRSNADNIHFPQRCVVGLPNRSNLTCLLEIGGASDFGAAFEILLVEANEDANRSFDRYMAQPERQGLAELPAGHEAIYSTQVVRKGRKETQP